MENVKENTDQRKCRGADLKGCPDKETAVCETTSRLTWKGPDYAVTVYVCRKCSERLVAQTKAG